MKMTPEKLKAFELLYPDMDPYWYEICYGECPTCHGTVMSSASMQERERRVWGLFQKLVASNTLSMGDAFDLALHAALFFERDPPRIKKARIDDLK